MGRCYKDSPNNYKLSLFNEVFDKSSYNSFKLMGRFFKPEARYYKVY